MNKSEAGVKAHQERVVKSISDALKFGVTFQPSKERWNRTTAGTPNRFELRATQPLFQSAATRAKGGRCQVVPLTDEDREGFRLWASFREDWQTRLRGEYDLVSLRWAFFWGSQVREEKRLVLRAEWELGGDKHAQPHWHINWSELSELRDQPLGAPADVEQQLTGILDLSVAGVHLPMAGWTHSREVPACWSPQPSNISDLEHWCKTLLMYVLHEAPSISRYVMHAT